MAPANEGFLNLSISEQTKCLYLDGTFMFSIRYYGYKVNLYLYKGDYLEVFYNHKLDLIEKIQPLDYQHTRMKFYEDQIKIKSVAI